MSYFACYMTYLYVFIHIWRRFYRKNDLGEIVNSPYVDNSYKWAGGGLLSTVGDLVKFGNAMLYSYQSIGDNSTDLPGYLKPDTVRKIWTPVSGTKYQVSNRAQYAMGWGIIPAENAYGGCRQGNLYVTHSGRANGASSVLLMMPAVERCTSSSVSASEKGNAKVPKGVTVAIIVNMEFVRLYKTARIIAETFNEAAHDSK